MLTPISEILKAVRADKIPEASSGLWMVMKAVYENATPSDREGKKVVLPAGTYTHLIRITTSKLHQWPPGDVVMEDTPFEIKTHLNFMLRAHGNVLITGLGLGCVIRGLLVNPNVKHVTCIEKSQNVLDLVEPYMPKDRLTIIKADALKWCFENKNKFDCAWHDISTVPEEGERSLSTCHTELLAFCYKRVKFQGAWSYPRIGKRLAKNRNISLI